MLINQKTIAENQNKLGELFNHMRKDLISMSEGYNETVKANNSIAKMVADIKENMPVKRKILGT